MAGRYENVNGVWQPVKKRYDKVGGIWQPTKKRLVKVGGVWQPSFSAEPAYTLSFTNDDRVMSSVNGTRFAVGIEEGSSWATGGVTVNFPTPVAITRITLDTTTTTQPCTGSNQHHFDALYSDNSYYSSRSLSVNQFYDLSFISTLPVKSLWVHANKTGGTAWGYLDFVMTIYLSDGTSFVLHSL